MSRSVAWTFQVRFYRQRALPVSEPQAPRYINLIATDTPAKVMEHIMVKEEQYQPDYSSNPWAEMNDYHSSHSQSPATELHAYGFVPSSQQQNMHSEPYSRPMQPMYSLPQAPQPMFAAQWPSMLTNPSSQPQPPPPPQMPAPPPPVTPVTTFATGAPLPPLTTHQPTHTTTSRRTLTDQDRRRMCQYHEDNPTVKQTEIGGKSELNSMLQHPF